MAFFIILAVFLGLGVTALFAFFQMLRLLACALMTLALLVLLGM